MSDGVAVRLANAWLNWLAGTAGTPPSALWLQLHTGAPGASGTANVSSVTTREQVTLGSASGGSISETNTPTWSNWAGTNGEVDTDISFWDASTSGNFWDSVQLTSSVTMNTGYTLQMATLTIAFTTAS